MGNKRVFSVGYLSNVEADYDVYSVRLQGALSVMGRSARGLMQK